MCRVLNPRYQRFENHDLTCKIINKVHMQAYFCKPMHDSTDVKHENIT